MPLSFHGARRARRPAVWTLLAALLIAPVGDVLGDDDEGHFEIRTAFVELRDGVYYLNGRVDYALSLGAMEALEGGAPLTFKLKIELSRVRRLLPDAEVAGLRQRYRLRYHALTERYLVDNLNSGDRSSFASLEAALDYIGRIDGLPLIDAALIDDDREYELSLRAELDVRELPTALRWLTFWWGEDLKISSEWYTWPLAP